MKTKILILLVGISLVHLIACERKIVPQSVLKPEKENYDSAAFDYVFIEGTKLKMIGNAGEALRYFEQCLKLRPNSDATYYEISQILLANGNLKEGREYLSKAISYSPENKWYPVMMAGTYYQEGKIDSAILYYEKAVKNSPEKEEILITLGNLYSENKQYVKAIEIYNSLDKKYGTNETTTLSTVKNFIWTGDYKKAYDKIIELIKINPDELLYYGFLAEIYRGMGDKDKATEVYNQLMEKSPDNPGTLLSLSGFLIQEKNYDDLIRLLAPISMNQGISREDKISFFGDLIEIEDLTKNYGEQLLLNLMVLEASYKDDNVIQILRPDLLIKLKNYQSAIKRLEEITISNKGNYYAWEKLLLAYLDIKDYKNLQLKGSECSSLFNRSFIAKILYATGATENKDYNTGLDELKKAEILAGDDKDMKMQVYSMRADIYYRMQDYTNAFNTYEDALKVDDNDFTILNNYAYYLAEQNMKLKEAELMAKRVIDNEKENATFLDTYAWVLYKRGKYKEAEKIMKNIIKEKNISDAELYEHYGYILKKRNNCNEAIENWNLALKQDSTKTELYREIENCKK